MHFKMLLNKKFLVFIFLTIIFSFVIYLFINKLVLAEDKPKEEYIKWVEFSPSYSLLEKTSNLDIKSHNEGYPVKYNWIELISYLSSKYYGNLKNFKQADLDNLIAKLNSGVSMEEITKDMKLYSYYLESYTAILGGFIGEYEIKNDSRCL